MAVAMRQTRYCRSVCRLTNRKPNQRDAWSRSRTVSMAPPEWADSTGRASTVVAGHEADGRMQDVCATSSALPVLGVVGRGHLLRHAHPPRVDHQLLELGHVDLGEPQLDPLVAEVGLPRHEEHLG